jgi:hypothetical protein
MIYTASCTYCNHEEDFYDTFDLPEGYSCNDCGDDICDECAQNYEGDTLCGGCYDNREFEATANDPGGESTETP